MKKTLCALLALLLVLPAFTACGKDDQPDVSSNTDVSSDVSGSDGTDTDEEKLGIPLTADYGDEEFRILTCGNVTKKDFTVEEESALVLDNAQYKRKRKVEEDYRVKIVQDVMSSGTTDGAGNGYKEISKNVNAGDYVYDFALISSYEVGKLASNGCLYDLASIPGIDLSKSWWDKRATDALTVRGITFFSVGDITIANNDAAMVIMLNKGLLENYNLDDPYQMVYDGTWTWENFGKLCKMVTEDLNQDGLMDRNDLFGLLVWDDSSNAVPISAGQRCCTVNPDTGMIELSLYNETTLSALEQYFDIAYDTQYAFTYQRVNLSECGQTMWLADQALLWTTYMGNIPGFREMETDFGILPYPKLTEQQKDYYSLVTPYNGQYVCVPLIQKDIERVGVITEALAYYGQKVVLPAYYDLNLVGQLTRDEESSDMLDIIFDNLVYDFGMIYQIGTYQGKLITMVRAYNRNFTSIYQTYKPVADNQLKQINEAYQKAVTEWQK